jgi:hypothetical protein
MAEERTKIDLHQIPADWITIDPKGEIVIKDKHFSESVKRTLENKAQKVLRDNGGCSCN